MTSPRAAATRERILEAAHRIVLDQGFAAASLDRVLGDAGVTKGAFFHHFRSKADLAEALAARYAAAESAALDALFARAEALAGDPLQRLLLLPGLLAEVVGAPGAGLPGCLLASFLYEKDLVTPGVRRQLVAALDVWRSRFAAAVRAAAACHPPRTPVDPEVLADHANVVIEGAFIMARAEGSADAVGVHMRELRRYLELLFEAPPPATRGPRRRRGRGSAAR